MPVNRDNIYNTLPLIYDHLMRSINYKDWADYIYAVTKPYLPVNQKLNLLELGAGNCKLSKKLKLRYKNIIASDISKNMLASGKTKYIPAVCCDMTDLPFNYKFNFVFSAFDTVNYLTSKKKLLKLFKEINRVLKHDGIFTFDASLIKNSIKHVNIPVRKGKYKNIEYVHHSVYKPKSRIHKNVFTIEYDGKVISEIHKEKIYDFFVYFELAEKAKLEVIDCLDAFTYEEASEESYRAQFILTKKK